MTLFINGQRIWDAQRSKTEGAQIADIIYISRLAEQYGTQKLL
jgi:hypothetical protein